MPGKHHQSSFAARHRYPLIVGAVLLAVAVAGTLAAISNRQPDPGAPLLVTPVLSASSPTVSATRSAASPSPSASARPSRSPSARRTPARPSAAPAPAFAARYLLVSGRRSTFRAGIFITNQGRTARSWRLVITHDPDDGVRVEDGAGARMTVSGSTITFDGGPLDPGDTVTVGYRATASTDRSVRPASCRIEGRSCTVSERSRNDSWRGRR